MKRHRYKIPLLTLAVSLIVLLTLSTDSRESCSEEAQIPTYPLLRECFDQHFHHAMETALEQEFRGEYKRAIENKRAAFVMVDITDLRHPKAAGVNPDAMLYAASLPKIAMLLGAFVQIENGAMQLNDETRNEMTRMIRNSSNKAATAVLNRIGI